MAEYGRNGRNDSSKLHPSGYIDQHLPHPINKERAPGGLFDLVGFRVYSHKEPDIKID